MRRFFKCWLIEITPISMGQTMKMSKNGPFSHFGDVGWCHAGLAGFQIWPEWIDLWSRLLDLA
jgi:hypothetical protein